MRPWHTQARPEQLPPADGGWRTYLVTAGRGWGKSRVGAEWIAEQAATHPGTQWAAVSDTWRAAGGAASTVLQAAATGELESYTPSSREIRFANGSLIRGFSSNAVASMRGYSFAGAWVDEVPNLHAAWGTISSVVTGQLMVTTTPPDDLPLPRPDRSKQSELFEFLRDLATRADTIHVNGSSWENAANLSPASLAELRRRYTETVALY